MHKNLVSFDWAMKKLLRSKANFGILEGFLSELLKQDIKILDLLDSESHQTDQEGKQNCVNIMAQLYDGEIILIEVQVNVEQDYIYRMLYTPSTIISEYLKKEESIQAKKVYLVNVLYFNLGHSKDYIYHGATQFIGIHEHDKLDLNIKKIYPEYYLIKVKQFNDIVNDTLDEWIYFLKRGEIKTDFSAKGLLEANEKLSKINFFDRERQAYQRYLDGLHYEASMVESNFDAGLVEGKKMGIEEGEKVGLEKGKLEIATKMKSAGVSAELIRQVTGLDIDKL